MKKKIAVIASAMALPGEKGYTRFPYLANLMCEYGYAVDIYTSTFNHWEKAQRDLKIIELTKKKVPYNIFLVQESGYKKNVDINRVISHHELSKNIVPILEQENKKQKYDLIYCGIPDNEFANCVCSFAKKNSIPVIIDIEDLWPEGMKLVFNVPIISDIVFFPFSFNAKKAYEKADAYVGTSDEFRDEPLKYGVSVQKPRVTVYVGCDLEVFDRGYESNKHKIIKSDGEFWVVYAGTLGSSYDIGTLVKAAQIAKERGYENIKFKILGGGPLKETFESIASEKPCNVEFVGYMPYEMMATYLVKSDVTINSFVKSAPQSIVNKIGDYLAAGKPMINTCSSKEFRLKVDKDGFGINVEAENDLILFNAIMNFYNNREICKEMGAKARRIAEEQFDRKNSYKTIMKMIVDLCD